MKKSAFKTTVQKSLPYLWPKWRQNSHNRYPIYDQNGWKTLPFGAAHTYIAHIREYPPRALLAGYWPIEKVNQPESDQCFQTSTRTDLSAILKEVINPGYK